MKNIFLFWVLFFYSLSVTAQTWIELNDSLTYYYRNGQFYKGIIIGEKALVTAKKESGENHPDYATSLNNLALLYSKMDQYEKAEPLYIQAKEIRKNVLGENSPYYSTSLNNLAMLYHSMGLYEKAEPLYIQAMEVRKNVLGETHPYYARSLNNLAGLYSSMGQYKKAEPLYILAKEILKNVMGENHPDYATTLNNLAVLYENIGQYEKAESLYIHAKEIRKTLPGENHPDYAASLNNLAILYKTMGQYEKAETLYIQAKEIFKNVLGNTHPDYATSLNNLASLYKSMGQYEKAEQLYIQANEIGKNMLGENHPDYAISLNNQARLYENMGQYQKAEQLYIQAKEVFKKLTDQNHPFYATSLNNLALLYASIGYYEKAWPFLLLNSHIILQNLKNTFTILSEKEKGEYLKNSISIIQTNNSYLYNYRKAPASIFENNFNLQLFFKSLSLTETQRMLESVSNSKDSSLRTIFMDWQSAKRMLAKQYSLPANMRRPDLASIEIKTETQEKELTRKSSEFLRQKTSLQISIQDVQKKLQNNEVAIEFVRFHLYNKRWTDSTIYAAYILNKKDSVPVFVPLCEEKQLQLLFDSSGSTATSMVSSFYRGLELKNKKGAGALGRELYKLIWQPIEPYLKGVKKVNYSPAGKLYSIAFHALPVDSTTLLMDKYHLQQYSSTRQVVLREQEKQNSKPQNIILFGNAIFTMDSLQLVKQKNTQPAKENVSTSIYTPQKRSSDNNTWNNLPGTAEEVNKIKQLFDQNKITTRSFIQTAASEENLKALSGNSPQILHIATHGFFLPEPGKKKTESESDQGNTYTLADDPLLRTGLILAGGNYAWSGKTPIEGIEDGIATAYEISQLNLSNTELVVLSACETALGDIKGSEGVFGLQRAFKMAGVKKMIVSLWQVPDKETAELMTIFYTYWMKGKTINDSFAQAQADMRKKYSPFYWAGFVLVE